MALAMNFYHHSSYLFTVSLFQHLRGSAIDSTHTVPFPGTKIVRHDLRRWSNGFLEKQPEHHRP
jgi:hypothetical protein